MELGVLEVPQGLNWGFLLHVLKHQKFLNDSLRVDWFLSRWRVINIQEFST